MTVYWVNKPRANQVLVSGLLVAITTKPTTSTATPESTTTTPAPFTTNLESTTRTPSTSTTTAEAAKSTTPSTTTTTEPISTITNFRYTTFPTTDGNNVIMADGTQHCKLLSPHWLTDVTLLRDKIAVRGYANATCSIM
ncbi:hypothetical protein TELCIR_07718 [Teladorsagia circumcincta]|uniref:Uncharacterized protein n=1 Tax=Teladorsagia circumcincta TaxID=45464 RepID=A0A2G9UJV0_TELCI|nr:hypothetical protein TELCIR_07718 [Teladorsagia circumcincta]